jgi:hypothetical protein
MKTLIIFVLLLFGISEKALSTLHLQNKSNYNFKLKVKINYDDAEIFWITFKKFANSKNYQKIAEMTYFPFAYQNTIYNKEEFKDFTFSDDLLKAIRKIKFPKKSKSTWTIKEKRVAVWEVSVENIYTSLFFCKVSGQWKFVGILQGD